MQLKQLSVAVLVCGALDIGYAIVSTMIKGGTGPMVLRGLASGPFGDAVNGWGAGGAILGLAVHFAIMTVMVATYFALAGHSKLGTMSPWLAGLGYGSALYAVMYCIVLPLRWPSVYPLTDPTQIALSLFPHIAFVGIPLAFFAHRSFATVGALSR